MSSFPSKQPHICWNKDWSILLPAPPLQKMQHLVKNVCGMPLNCTKKVLSCIVTSQDQTTRETTKSNTKNSTAHGLCAYHYRVYLLPVAAAPLKRRAPFSLFLQVTTGKRLSRKNGATRSRSIRGVGRGTITSDGYVGLTSGSAAKIRHTVYNNSRQLNHVE